VKKATVVNMVTKENEVMTVCYQLMVKMVFLVNLVLLVHAAFQVCQDVMVPRVTLVMKDVREETVYLELPVTLV